MEDFLAVFESPWDVVGLVLFILVFPVYHTVYPWIASRRPGHAARSQFDALRESWIERLIARSDVITAAQLTRNLTMVSSLLVSSALILMGISVNTLLSLPEIQSTLPHPDSWAHNLGAVRFKLYMLIVTFALAFSFFMTALRHLGHFVLLIGADPELVASSLGPPVKYFAGLINRASHRYTLGMRSFYAAFPLFAWLFDVRLFVLITAFWGLKFAGFQDFSIRRWTKGSTEPKIGDEDGVG